MEGDRVHLHPSCETPCIPRTSTCAPPLHGAISAVVFDDIGGGEALRTIEMEIPLTQAIVKAEINGYGEELDMSETQPTKKRRLTSKQLLFLESNFAAENKLEPERKLQLAKELGLEPRQVAIWFQNRRARFKNKQLEKDYDSLKDIFEKLKGDFESLVKEKEMLEYEISSLKGKLADKERGMAALEESHYHHPDQSTTPWSEMGEKPCKLPVVINASKQEDASSAKSDVFDSDSPQYLLGSDQPDQFSQDGEDHHQLQQPCSKASSCFLSSSICCSLPKLCHDPSPDSCNYGLCSVEDQPFWTWTTYGGLHN